MNLDNVKHGCLLKNVKQTVIKQHCQVVDGHWQVYV